MTDAPDKFESEKIAEACKPHLAGKGPELQSAALAELAALWLCGMPDLLRAGMLVRFVELITNLVPIVELELFQRGHHPQNEGLHKGGMVFTIEQIMEALVIPPKESGE